MGAATLSDTASPSFLRHHKEDILLSLFVPFMSNRAFLAVAGTPLTPPPRRALTAALVSFTLLSGGAYAPQPAYAANCVKVVLRDPYWGRYQQIVRSGWTAAGVGAAFARHGFAVDDTPSVGAIMVWPSSYAGASYAGHVGIVDAVHDNGTVLVRHENWPYGWQEHVQVFTVRPGHRFVHQHVAAVPAAEPATEATPPETASAGEGEA
ncbi:MAG: CHAP domain-containing protein [Chloroflexota bacterium]